MIAVRSMAGRPAWVAAAAVWWHRQWGSAMGYSPEGAVAAIEALLVPQGGQAAFIALVDDRPAGSVFVVDADLDTHTHLTPWLAGLFVLPECRGRGLGARLVDAATAEARRLNKAQLHLYTSTPAYYRRLGWRTTETVDIHGVTHDIMGVRP